MKSGNHTDAPQWIYCGIHMIFFVIPNPFVFKLGIGGSWMNRTGDIGRSMKLPGFILPIFLVWVPYARRIEKWSHKQMKALNVPYFGSGRTEWFFILGVLFAIPVMAAAFIGVWGSLAYLLAYAVGWEKDAHNVLKWVGEHPTAFLSFVGAGKLAVIFGQIIWKNY